MNEQQRFINYGVKSLRVKKFRGIGSANLEDIAPNTPWIFLTGRNGYGKTCLLQAIFLGLWGRLDDSGMILEQSADFEIFLSGYAPTAKGEFDRTVRSINISGTFGDTRQAPIPVVAYGPSRLSLQASSDNEALRRSAASYSLFNPDGVLLNIEYELKSWAFRSSAKELEAKEAKRLKEKFDNVILALIKLLPNISCISVNPKTDRVYYTEENAEGQALPGKRVLEEIPSGSKSILAMVGDMMIRLFRNQEHIVHPSHLEGIIIIDELDLHLHPSWQKVLPSLLCEVFPKVQFIASTHSPIPFLGAPKNSVFIKVDRSPEDGISVEKLAIPIEDLTPNLILSSPIFGFTEIFPVTHASDGYIRTEELYREMELTDLVEERLRTYRQSEKEQALLRVFSKSEEKGDDSE